jgi:energy-coupling factor transport system ATP-binding protein
MDKEIVIEAQNLVFGYRKDVNIIDHQNLSLFKGETVALTGPNGMGKTTLGKLLTGILRPSSGKCVLFGEDATTIPLSRIGQRVGYCFQNPEQQLFTVSVEEEIAFGLKYRGASREDISNKTDFLLNLFEIEYLRKAFPYNLSWGEKRRVVLAASLALEPEYLVLDEPTTGLDKKRIEILNQVIKKLQRNGIGILLISHNQSFIEENAQRILLMERGGITDECCR